MGDLHGADLVGEPGAPVKLAGHNADVLRRQEDGIWRFVTTIPGERTESR